MTDPEQRQAALAELLCHAYEYGVGLDELRTEDPNRAQEHLSAAAFLLGKLEQAPFNEKRAAFQRGYTKGRDSEKKANAGYVAELEAALAELRQDRDPEGLRARIADLEYTLAGYMRRPHDPGHLLARLATAQRELAILKGVQPTDATGERPSV